MSGTSGSVRKSDMDGLLLRNCHLLEPVLGELQDRSWLRVADGKIVDTGTRREPSVGDDVRVLDAEGCVVIPGLIDAHVHLLPVAADAAEAQSWSPGYAAVRAALAARQMLHRGFTSVRDVGGADYGLARVLDEGLIEGPNLFYGGRSLTQSGGHGDMRSMIQSDASRYEEVVGFSQIVDGPQAVRRACREEFRRGASHVKLLVTGGVMSPSDDIRSMQYSEEEIRTAVEEAGNANRYVAVHAYHSHGVQRALSAGVRCIEHGNLVDAATIALLRRLDAFLVPTLVTYEQLWRSKETMKLSDFTISKLEEVRNAGPRVLEEAHRAGVNVVFGTDLLGDSQRHQSHELRLRAEVQPLADVLRGVTAVPAKLLGRVGRKGCLDLGADADRLVLGGNPLEDIGVLTQHERYLKYVIKSGAVLTP
jgi:imidazolonepropionase-like amidohydrolase